MQRLSTYNTSPTQYAIPVRENRNSSKSQNYRIMKKYTVCVDYINLDGTTERIKEFCYEQEYKAEKMKEKCKKYYYPQKESFQVYTKIIES